MENSIDYTSGRPATAAVSGLSILQQQQQQQRLHSLH